MRTAAAGFMAAVSAGNTWIPIHTNGKFQYFSPDLNKLVSALPEGDDLAPALDWHTPQLRLGLLGVGKAGFKTGDDDEIVSQDDSSSQAKTVSAVTNDAVVQGETQSCFPTCTWNCTQPVCNQDCSPDCEQPRCQTRCPRPDYSQCKIDCHTPHCSVFCPKKLCSGNGKCSSPKCSTQCARAVCAVKCANRIPCQNVCQPPRCSWNCRNPRVCSKPECKLVCDRPLGCAQNYELPPLSPSLTVEKSFTADRARWIVYPWGTCGMECGKSTQTRKVVCSTGQDHECAFGVKPATQQECESHAKCNSFQTSSWSKCSAICGYGKQTRKVWCDNEDKNECFGEKPTDTKDCKDFGDHCSICKVSLFGGPYFNEWKVSLSEGEYGLDQLTDRGVKCEEISSMKVHGVCCSAKVYQYGDFNRAHKGWEAKLSRGAYDQEKLEEKDVQNNDISSVKVVLDQSCAEGASGGHHRGKRSSRSSGLGDGVGEEIEEIEDAEGSGKHGSHRGSRNKGTGNLDSWTEKAFGGGNKKAGDSDRDLLGGDGETEGRRPNGPASKVVDAYPWWFWVVVGLLVIAVVFAVVIAARRARSG